jgi:MoaA/NifB/PqqE/SkfB family radical SAM enzyme
MEGSSRRREHLPFEWIDHTVREAPELGIGTLFLTGGEPLLYNRFVDVARVAGGVNGLSTIVCTNAMLVRPREAELFASLRFNVHVSIDGDSQYHDFFRCANGAFREAERGVKLLVDLGVPVTIVTTVSRGNFDQFGEILRWVVSSGATRLLVQPLLSLGRGSLISSQQLSSEQLNMLILQISDFANSQGKRISASIIGSNKQFLLAHPCAAYVCNGGGCHRKVSAEIKKVVVREDGTILPEATNLDQRYAIGNVNDGSLRNLLKDYFLNGYKAFDHLCRTTYTELVPDWPDPIVPWDQLLAIRSRIKLPDNASHHLHSGCGTKPTAKGSLLLETGSV